ncbi:hypothetical protein EN791_034050, partial [Mesorhizobium sp. M2D.F.Ca.ET.148.01.1.1]
LTGEIGFSAGNGTALLALGFGSSPEEAAEMASASLEQGFDAAAEAYVANWRPGAETERQQGRGLAGGEADLSGQRHIAVLRPLACGVEHAILLKLLPAVGEAYIAGRAGA